MSQWAVVKDGVSKTFTKIHSDEIEAHDEAKRLCQLEDKPFLVVHIRGRYLQEENPLAFENLT